MSATAEAMWSHASIPVELANLRPHGDFVLVRVLPEAKITGSIWHPDGAKENLSPRIGEVVAVGPGDKITKFHFTCCDCPDTEWTDSSRDSACPTCGTELRQWINTDRHPMHVKPGDRILYWRTYANEVVINEELFQLVHEEQHIVAVLED